MTAQEVRHRSFFERQAGCMMGLPTVRVPFEEQLPEEVGPWSLGRVPPMRRRGDRLYIAQRGYWSGFDWEPCFWYLVRDGRVWMSTSRMERESHALHLKHAKGVVVVCGVGLGMFLYNVCCKPDVTRVIAVDIDEHLLSWCRERARRWVGGDKIKFLYADAKELNRTMLSREFGVQELPDYLYVDIWSDMDPDCALPDVQHIQGNVRARVVSWWTQEIAFVRWCMESGVPKGKIDLDAFDCWSLDTGLLTPERSGAYLRYCVAVARNTTLRPYHA